MKHCTKQIAKLHQEIKRELEAALKELDQSCSFLTDIISKCYQQIISIVLAVNIIMIMKSIFLR